MKVNIDESWKKHLNEEFDKAYFKDLVEFVKNEYQKHTCYPKGQDIFVPHVTIGRSTSIINYKNLNIQNFN